jgi:hypothetical protein
VKNRNRKNSRKENGNLEAKRRNGKTQKHNKKIRLKSRNPYHRNKNIIEMMKHH